MPISYYEHHARLAEKAGLYGLAALNWEMAAKTASRDTKRDTGKDQRNAGTH